MRQDATQFVTFERAKSKEPRFVVEIVYASGSIFLTSHSDIANLPGSPATILQGVLRTFFTQSQRLQLDQGRAEIGSGKFSVVDKALGVTLNIRSKLAAGTGPRKQTVKYWKGYKPIDAAPDWTKFVLLQTQLLSGDAFDIGVYDFSSEDISREARKDIFDLASTNLTVPLSSTDTTINVSSTADFETLAHAAHYSDAPSQTVGYLKIKNEVIRYTGKTSTTFTGCARGVLGTQAAAYAVDTTLPPERREKVTEHVFLEEPAVKLLYAILTGSLYGTVNVLPTGWHLGIDPSFVRIADFLAMTDLWNTAVETESVIFRFEGITKTDGKAFVEKEIAFALGLFMPIYSDGAIGLRRMTRALPSSAAVFSFDESNIIEMGPLDRQYSELLNGVVISWSYRGNEAQRTTVYIDADSIALHKSSPPKKLSFRGIHGSRHTEGVLRKAAARILDAYGAPPIKTRIKALSSMSAVEVGDIVRVRHAGQRDYAASAGASLDRSMMVIGVANSQESGEIEIDLFGSSATGKSVAPVTGALLPLAFYNGRGTNLASVLSLTLVGSEWVVQANATLTGNVNASVAGAEFYFDGDLKIPAGIVITIVHNVHLKTRGFLTVDGKIDGKGNGQAGAVDDGTGYTGAPFYTGSHAAGLPGYVGNTRGYDGLHVYQRSGNPVMQTLAPAITVGKHATAPELELSYDTGTNTIKGLPTDLRGTSGGQGGKTLYQGAHVQAGGSGGDSGAGLTITSRGLALGASGEIDLSGDDGGVAGFYPFEAKGYYAGGGAGGGPGTMIVLLDGDSVPYPSLTGQFRARVGLVPQPTSPPVKTYLDTTDAVRRSSGDQPYGGYPDPRTISDIDLSFACLRVQHAPGVEVITPDASDVPPPVTTLVAVGIALGILVKVTPPNADSFDVIEYWSSTTNDRNTASRIAWGRFSEFVRGPLPADTTEYFWARTVKDGVTSDFFPLSATAGTPGTALFEGARPFSLVLTNVTQNGARLTKTGGANDTFDAQAYSVEGYSQGCVVKFRPGQTNKYIFAGLNTDPAASASEANIDFAWYLHISGNTFIYESGVLVTGVTTPTYTTNTQFEIRYDGGYVTYLADGVEIRKVIAPGRRLYFDSAFYSSGGVLQDLKFEPLNQSVSSLIGFVARGSCRVGRDVIEKDPAGAAAWDSDVYSVEGYLGCQVQFRAAQTDKALIIGLDSSPADDSNYTSIDFSWYCQIDGTLQIIESNVGFTGFGAYTTATLLEIVYDGQNVRYRKDGVVVRTVATGLRRMFMDSSFYTAGAKAFDVRLFPLNELTSSTDANLVFIDTFDHQNWQARYNNRGNDAGLVVTYPAEGSLGGRVLQAASGQLWIASAANIPFDPNALYRVTARVRRRAGSGGAQLCYVGVEGVAADGVTLINESGANSASSQHYNALRAFDLGGVTIDDWVTAVGYFKGHAASGFGVSPVNVAPTPLYTGVAYVRPLVILNSANGTGTQQVDYLKIERLIVPDDADNTDRSRLIPDAEFSRSTTKGVFWDWSFNTGSPTSTVQLLSSGGVEGGVAEISLGTGVVTLGIKRYPTLRPVITGTKVRATIRIRRTTAITLGASGYPLVSLYLTQNSQGMSLSNNQLAQDDVPIVVTDPSTWNLNEWQEFSGTYIMQNRPKNLGQYPFFYAELQVGAAGNSGTLQIDNFDVWPI